MNYTKLLLKSVKIILPTTIGCAIGILLYFILFNGMNIFTTKHVLTYFLGFIISFFILTSITWLIFILKSKKV